MARQRSILRPFWRFCAIGLAVSIAVTVLYAINTGLLRNLEALSLDWRFRNANSRLHQSDEIRLIAIDDQSLTQIGRWPWPRKHMADLVDVLKEAGAARIAMDLHFPEPQRVLELDEFPTDGSSDAGRIPVEYDTLFANAIARAGNVYLPIVADPISGDLDLQAAQQTARELASRNVPLSEEQFGRRVGLPTCLLGPDAYLRCRIACLLRDRFWLSAASVAQQLAAPVEKVSSWIGIVKRQVALEQVSRYLQSHPDATADSTAQAILQGPGAPTNLDSPEIRWAYQQARARAAVRDALIDVPAGVLPEHIAGLLQAASSYDVQVPIAPLAAQAAGFGHVAVVRETDGLRRLRESDGVVRRLPLLLRWDDKLVPQMALRLAGDMLGFDWHSMRIEPNQIIIPTIDGRTMHLPLDDTGQTLLNWYRPDDRWQSCFGGPVPAGAVLEIAEMRRAMHQNEALWQTRLLQLVQMIQPTELEQYKRSLDKARQIQEKLRAPKTATQPDPKDYRNLQDQLQQLRTGEVRTRTACIDLLKQEGPGLAAAIDQEKDPKERERLQECDALYKDIVQGRLRSQIDRTNGQLAQQIEIRKKELTARISGKTCLVGYTASALADTVSTPAWPVAPGMMIHAQLLNSLLENRLIWPVSRPVNTAIVLLCCLAVTLVTSAQGPRASLALMIGACVSYLAAACGLFQYASLEVALATPIIGMFVTWAMITSYRELTEERAKRRFARTLQQYTSPALARQMAENPDAITKAETRDVTCFFSDLKGFTGISERIGAQATQQILNVYLDRMTEVLDRHEALINKFLGDGIFAFFNPAIHPQSDHARRACIASLEAMEALEQLKHQAGSDLYESLHMRIGLASGLAVVGNCGSERKFDYTCIGDTVNLASRLEGANKTFGTGVLINGRCKDQLGEGLLLRHVGRVLVVGRAMYEETYELVGRAGHVDAQICENVERFEQAVRCFIAGNLSRARQGFEECCHYRSDDTAARYYLGLCEAYLKSELPATWNGTIGLTGK